MNKLRATITGYELRATSGVILKHGELWNHARGVKNTNRKLSSTNKKGTTYSRAAKAAHEGEALAAVGHAPSDENEAVSLSRNS